MSERPELDRELSGLRADLHAALVPPDLTKVAGRARQRSVRRRMQLGAVAAVVVVSVAVPALRAVPSDPPASPPPSTPKPTFQVEFADADHGYALRGVCEPAGGPCAYTLLATTNGGRKWVTRKLPGDGGEYRTAHLTVFGPDTVSVVRSPVEDDTDIISEYSSDGGERWVAERPVVPVLPARIEPGALLVPVCVNATTSGCDLGVGSTVAATGSVAPALTQPALLEPEPGGSSTAGGTWWTVGRDEATGSWALAVSGDDGAAWSTSVLEVPGKASTTGGWHVVEGDGVLYATVEGTVGTGPFGLLAVFRSTDRGVSWTRTWTGSDLEGALGSPVLTSDGRLLVYSAPHGTFESTDGRTFRPSAQQLPGPVKWTRAGYLLWTSEGRYQVSTDGVRWRKFTIR